MHRRDKGQFPVRKVWLGHDIKSELLRWNQVQNPSIFHCSRLTMNGTQSSSLVSSQGTSFVPPEKKTSPSPGILGWPYNPTQLPRMNSERHATQPGWAMMDLHLFITVNLHKQHSVHQLGRLFDYLCNHIQSQKICRKGDLPHDLLDIL